MSRFVPGPIAVVDVETTGLFPSRHDRILEIGIVVIGPNSEVTTEFESLVNPARDVGPTSVHGLTSEDVLGAPRFDEIAGHVLDTLKGTVALAGHNVRFDSLFLQAEFARIGCTWPQCELLCTMQLSGGGNLEECCGTFGVGLPSNRHTALADARAAAQLLSVLLQDHPALVSRLSAVQPTHWPEFRGIQKLALTRSDSREHKETQASYLQRLLSRRVGHALPEASDGASIAYGALLDRALEDRIVDEVEANSLMDVATTWGLSNVRIEQIHRDYLNQLIVTALADGLLSELELNDLRRVARILGNDVSSLDCAIQDASTKLNETRTAMSVASNMAPNLRGLKVCFTGELQEKVSGKRISREMAERIAETAGLTVVDAVTRSCDLLVVADPSSQSGKAKRARTLGVRVMHEAVFWKHIGASA